MDTVTTTTVVSLLASSGMNVFFNVFLQVQAAQLRAGDGSVGTLSPSVMFVHGIGSTASRPTSRVSVPPYVVLYPSRSRNLSR